jgi:hypothetical protein
MDSNLRDVHTVDIQRRQLFGGKYETASLRELCLRKAYGLSFDGVLAKSLGKDNKDLVSTFGDRLTPKKHSPHIYSFGCT